MDLSRGIRPYAWLLQILLLLPAPAAAQFVGFTSPQTVQQQLGTTNQACSSTPGPQPGTVTPQDFTVQNLGQTEHYVTVQSNGQATQFTVLLLGSDVKGNTSIISEQLEMAGGFAGSVFAAGYFPKVIVRVICQSGPSPAPTATYTLTYSGTWGTPAPSAGVFLVSQVSKDIFSHFFISTGIAHQFIPPFASSAGEIFFRFIGAGQAGAQLAVTCASQGGTGAIVFPATTLANSTTEQAFQIPNFPCPIVNVQFTQSAGTQAEIQLSYLFGTPGLSNWPFPASLTPVAASTN